jgi:hypothetical protein
MALLEITEPEAPLNPPDEGPHGLRRLDIELSDARVAISEALDHWRESREPMGRNTQQALLALSALGYALSDMNNTNAIDAAWLEVDRLWSVTRHQRPGADVDAAVWRAMYRVRAACWDWMAGHICAVTDTKKPSTSDEARMLGQVCREI